jgi:hypothetical protein
MRPSTAERKEAMMASTPPPEQPPTGGFEPPTPPGPPPEPPALALLPWEQPGYPLLEGLYETAKLIITRPGEAFSRMSTTGDLGRPLVYAVIFGWIGVIASQIYQLAFRGAMWSFIPNMPHREELMFGPVASVVTMIIAPVLILFGVFIGAAIVHLFLMMVGGATRGFATTVRVLCYASTTQVLQVVPFCGGIIGAVWTIVLEIIGIARAHRTTQGKAALAVLLPIALCCACLVVALATVGTAIWAAIANSR